MNEENIEGVIEFEIDYMDLAGNISKTLSVTDTSSVRFDKTLPTMTAVTVGSNNIYDPLLAAVENTIMITFTPSEAIQIPDVYIAGDTAEVSGDGSSWTAVRSMTEDDADGDISFVIDYLDLAGNYAQTLTTTDSTIVRFDKTLPSLPEISIFSSNLYDSTLATSGNTATINFVSDEIIQTPQVLIQGDTAIVTGDGQTWSAIQVLSQENIDGPVDFSIDYLDLAGNFAQSSQTTDESGVLFDKTLPVISDVIISSSNPSASIYALEGDSVTISFNSSENIMRPSVMIAGQEATVQGDSITWSASRVINSEDVEGLVLYNIDYLHLAGNVGIENKDQTTDSSQVIYDRTSPQGFTINDGEIDDISFTGSDSVLSANWDSFFDEISGVEYYEFSVGSSVGQADVVDWTNNGLDTTMVVGGIALSNTVTYYVSIRAFDVAGNISDLIVSDGVTVDLIGPSAGHVFDGEIGDIDWTNSMNSLSGNWTDFSDNLSGLSSYQYAIGTELDSFSLVSWRSVGIDTVITEPGLELVSGTTYYVFVRALDSALNIGPSVSSDGITVDLLAPEVANVNDGIDEEDIDWQASDSTLSFTWSGSDLREIYFYEYSIGSSAGDTSIMGWTDNGSDISVTVDSLSLSHEQILYGNVRVIDLAGNVSEVTSSDGITVDTVSPKSGAVIEGFEVDLDFTATLDSITATWFGFSDVLSDISHYEYSVGTTFSGSDILGWTFTDDTSMVLNDVTLENGSQYFVSVRAYDLAFNVSDSISSNGVITDIDVPITGVVHDGLEEDEVWTNSFNTLSANWTGFEDSISGIEFYEYAIGTSQDDSDIVDWINIGTDTFFVNDDLELISGYQYFSSIRATDYAGNLSSVVVSNGTMVDQLNPIVGIPIDGNLSEDIDWQSSKSAFSFSWDASDGRSRQLDSFEYSLSTVSGDSDIVSWTDNGSETFVTITDLDLEEGSTYFANIRAYDSAGNRSDISSSDGVVIDATEPDAGIVYDGLDSLVIDLVYTPNDSSLEAMWNGFADDLSGIKFYEVAIGTAEGDTNVLSWHNVSLDTHIVYSDTEITNGTQYYVSVRALDQAFNVSQVVSSDGVVIDTQPPMTGVIFDGSGADIDLLNQNEILSANWTSFYDSLSGIFEYQVAVGFDSLSNDQIDWTSTGINTSIDFDSLTLVDPSKYYISVRAIDNVGNISPVFSSDGVVVDGTGPVISSQSIDSGSSFSLVDTFKVDFIYSEPLESVDVLVSDLITGTYDYSYSGNVLQVAFTGPFASLDTIRITPIAVDFVGNVSDTLEHEFYGALLGDFNDDMVINAYDLGQFMVAWDNNDLYYDIGPVGGDVPNLIPDQDGAFSVRDAMAFRRMWYWSNSNIANVLAVGMPVGSPIDMYQSGNQIIIDLPNEIVASELVLDYPREDMIISNHLDIQRENDIVISKVHEKELVFQQVNGFAAADGEIVEKEIVFNVSGVPEKQNVQLVIDYQLMGDNNEVLYQGSQQINFTPMPLEFALSQNYPNPFNPITRIKYDLPEKSDVVLLVYDIMGREVATLINEQQEPGYRSIMWDGLNSSGQRVSAGMYFYTIQAGKFRQTKKMILLK